LPTQKSVVNLFQSIFTPAHDVSPWASGAENDSNVTCPKNVQPDIVILTIDPNDSNATKCLEDVRVSDTAPSWFLHAKAKLDSLEALTDLWNGQALVPQTQNGNDKLLPTVLWIFKKLGPRTCLFQTRPEDVLSLMSSNHDAKVTNGCLWESCVTESDSNVGETEHHHDSPSVPSYRLVCPPYVNLQQAYANTRIPELFNAESMLIFTQDALSIPRWTPWPESVHYKPTNSSGMSMPWTVFLFAIAFLPMCRNI
jgi:hypothetical protein